MWAITSLPSLQVAYVCSIWKICVNYERPIATLMCSLIWRYHVCTFKRCFLPFASCLIESISLEKYEMMIINGMSTFVLCQQGRDWQPWWEALGPRRSTPSPYPRLLPRLLHPWLPEIPAVSSALLVSPSRSHRWPVWPTDGWCMQNYHRYIEVCG